jgi:hypothetical protein
MAIDPSTKYSGQVDSDAGYPYGKAKNRSSTESTDGTPLERDWVNDLWGLLQKALDYDGATPSGTPDNITTSQYWDALYTMARTIKASETLAIAANGQIIFGSSTARINTPLGKIRVYGDGTIEIENNGLLLKDGSKQSVQSNGEIELEAGAVLDIKNGANIVLAGALNLTDVANINPTTYERVYNISPRNPDGSSGFTLESSYAAHLYWIQSPSPAGSNHFNLSLPDIHRKATVTAITAHVCGSLGHPGNWEDFGTKPRLYFGNVSYLTGSVSSYDWADDPSTGWAGYEQYHTIPLTGLSQPLSGTTTYPVISLRGESGTNAVGELKVFGIQVTVEFTDVECG